MPLSPESLTFVFHHEPKGQERQADQGTCLGLHSHAFYSVPTRAPYELRPGRGGGGAPRAPRAASARELSGCRLYTVRIKIRNIC